MRAFVVILLICLYFPFRNYARCLPKEGDTLHYRIIGFTFPSRENAAGYSIEIARGHHNNIDLFKKNLIANFSGKTNRIIGEVPAFGEQYTWRVVYSNPVPDAEKNFFYHFSTGAAPMLDTANVRIKISATTDKYKDGYFFMDGCKALYDMAGRLVWYMPGIDSFVDRKPMVRDMKLTDKGTITFLGDRSAYEISWDGAVLWKNRKAHGNSSDSADIYHHELTRLSNGHYMVLGYETVKPKTRIVKRDSVSRRVLRDSVMKARMLAENIRYGTVFEYDEHNNLVWEYKALDHFKTEDLSLYARPNGVAEYDPHQNSFYFDERNRIVYLGYRNLSQILKISYPAGKVLAAYGKPDSIKPTNDLFCGQHSCKRSSDGYLYLFNNGCRITSAPTVVVLKEPETNADTLKKIWEFSCPVTFRQAMPRNIPDKAVFTSGGCVTELPDKSFFVSVCNPYGLIFIVDRNKEVLWSCNPERWDKNKKIWSPVQQYRSYPVPSRKELEQLIWNSQK